MEEYEPQISRKSRKNTGFRSARENTTTSRYLSKHVCVSSRDESLMTRERFHLRQIDDKEERERVERLLVHVERE